MIQVISLDSDYSFVWALVPLDETEEPSFTKAKAEALALQCPGEVFLSRLLPRSKTRTPLDGTNAYPM